MRNREQPTPQERETAIKILSASGMSYRCIARVLAVHPQSVKYWAEKPVPDPPFRFDEQEPTRTNTNE